MAMRCLVVAGILFAQVGRASPGFLPTPTAAGLNLNYGEIEILPTSYPGNPSQLFKRLNGDPAICGWVEGNADNTVSCNSGYTCAATASFVGCCSTGAAGCAALYTTCYNGTTPSQSANVAALTCEGRIPYCATYLYASGSMGFGCAITPGYTKSVLTTTNSGVNHNPFAGSTTSSSSSASSSTSTSSSTSSSASATIPTPSHTADPSPSPSPAAATSSSSLSPGAIGGIAAGGSVALVLVATLAWCLLRKRRRERKLRESTLPHRTSNGEEILYGPGQKPEQDNFSWPMTPAGYMHNRPRSETTFDRTSTNAPSESGQPPFSPVSGRYPVTTADAPYSGPTIAELGTHEPSRLSTNVHTHE